MSSKIYQKIQTLYNPEGLTKNATRGRDSLANCILLHRKLSDVTQLDVFFHKYAKNGQVYTITDNPSHCGLDIPVKEYQSSIMDHIRKAKTSRTCNDGLRLSLTMLDTKYRGSIAAVMTNRKERRHSDISGDYVLHLFEEILVESFRNPQYRPPQPSRDQIGDIEEEELSQWDPNDPRIFEVDRDATWLLETWKTYVKRKYKSVLDRWNKETGGGNGQPWSFVNYCDKDARWLVLVFLKDVEANFLLSANAGGRMPHHLQLECGLETQRDVSSLEESCSEKPTNMRSKMRGKKRELMEAAIQTKKIKTDLTNVVDVLSALVITAIFAVKIFHPFGNFWKEFA
mmetsp:Transcript_121592/g.349491  ORF Transcript_121592/g.349491 Transcript_121592/m.349491 type:complete len:342 (-) Transcript_121592:231-1256(-)